jgi:hypothetical protein
VTAPDLSLVVPCYDEADHLRASVAEVVEILEENALDVGDRSSSTTGAGTTRVT